MSRRLLSHSSVFTKTRPSIRTRQAVPLISSTQLRCQSDWSHLQTSLPQRRLPLVYDYLVPTPSHLLNISVSDTLPRTSSTPNASPRTLPSTISASPLPPTHHLIYFPPAIPGYELLADGTDPLQSPGEPFVRRMWAGGSVLFNNSSSALKSLLALDGGRAVCVERIRDVTVKGKEGDEKIFVGIERRVGRCSEDEPEESIRSRLERDSEQEFGESGVVERRNIVFMRERSKEQAQKDMEKAKTKMMKPPTAEEGVKADFQHDIMTDPKLLFRYSALTYNAHAIHLDPAYCRDVEGHRGLLVHGPLSFTMLLTRLRMHLSQAKGQDIGVKSVEYRNLSPLYCEEPIKLAGREKEEGKWEVWAETPEGGVAVKGTVKTEKLGSPVIYGDMGMLGIQ